MHRGGVWEVRAKVWEVGGEVVYRPSGTGEPRGGVWEVRAKVWEVGGEGAYRPSGTGTQWGRMEVRMEARSQDMFWDKKILI